MITDTTPRQLYPKKSKDLSSKFHRWKIRVVGLYEFPNVVHSAGDAQIFFT